jgi:hypothetical protein
MGRHAEEGIQGQESRRSGKELKTRRSSHDLGPQDSTHTAKSKESKSRKNRKASIEAVPYVEPKDVEVRSTHSAERIGDRKRNPHLEHVRDTRVNDTLSELNSVVSNTQYSVPGYEKFKEESGPMDSQFQERVKGEKTGTLTQVGNADMAALMADIQTKIDALLMDTKRDENDDDILSAQIERLDNQLAVTRARHEMRCKAREQMDRTLKATRAAYDKLMQTGQNLADALET